MSTAAIIRLIALGAIWGASFLFQRVAVPAFGPAPLIAIRLSLAALLLGAVAILASRALLWRQHWRQYMVVGAVNSAIPFFLFAYAAQTLPASLLALFNSLAPIFAGVVGSLWLKSPFTRRTAMGLACGVAGVGSLTISQLLQPSALTGHASALLLPLGAALLAPVCYGIAANYIKSRTATGNLYATAHGAMWAASALTLPFAILFAPTHNPGPLPWFAALALGVLCTGVAYLLQFRLIEELGPTRALSVAFLIPLFGVLWGVLFLGEHIGLGLLAGGVLILGGMMLTLPTAIWKR